MTPRQLEYQEYLKSHHWAGIRKRALSRDKRRCTRCHAVGLELHVHHLIYRPNFYDTVLEDVTTLCHLCHWVAHPEHHKPVPVAYDYKSYEELVEARRTHKLQRWEFKMLAKKFKPQPKRKKKLKPGGNYISCKIYYYTRNSKTRWKNRGTSSN